MADKNTLSGFLLEGSSIKGELTFLNRMTIDGEFSGDIKSRDRLTIGKNARVDANIKVSHIEVLGHVQGTISECDLLEIHEGGVVQADIEVKTLDIKPGAIFHGKSVMILEKGGGQK